MAIASLVFGVGCVGVALAVVAMWAVALWRYDGRGGLDVLGWVFLLVAVTVAAGVVTVLLAVIGAVLGVVALVRSRRAHEPAGTRAAVYAIVGTALCLAFLLATSGSLVTWSGSRFEPPDPVETTTPPPAQSVRIGEAAVGEGVRLTVTKVVSGVRQVGPEHFKETPEADQFILVRFRIDNTGTTADRWSTILHDFTAYDSAGREYEHDRRDAFFMRANDRLDEDVSPGASVTGIAVFDATADTMLTRVVIDRSGELPGGVEITLD